MTAPFAAALCGYRLKDGNPSISDGSQTNSVDWGRALFRELDVPTGQIEMADVGAQLEIAVVSDLLKARPDLSVNRSLKSSNFEQYRHLAVLSSFESSYKGPSGELEQALEALRMAPDHPGTRIATRHILAAQAAAAADDSLINVLITSMADESLLRLDVTVANTADPPRLLAGLSCKWSLRTDRAQDPITQGLKLVSQRRGPMPHYAVLTMEPRPMMLRLIAYGSGAVDCVYHVALKELLQAAAALEIAKPSKTATQHRALLNRMVSQGRIRPYGDLVAEVNRLPHDRDQVSATL